MIIRAPYVPVRYPRYPGRSSTLSRAHAPLDEKIGARSQTGHLPPVGKHILIIEERTVSARPLMLILQRWGHDVAISDMESLASQNMHAQGPDIVILSGSWLNIDNAITAKLFAGRQIRLVMIGGSQEAVGRLRRDHDDVQLLVADWQLCQLSAALQTTESRERFSSLSRGRFRFQQYQHDYSFALQKVQPFV